jgi:hypothetical protein
LEGLIAQVSTRLIKEKAYEGMDTFIEMVESGVIAGLHHFNAPLPDGNVMRFDILRESNAEVARHWPCDVWRVTVMSPNIYSEATPATPKYVEVEDMEVRGTFRNKEDANQRAGQVLEELKVEAGGRASLDKKILENGLFQGFVTAGRRYGKVVQVDHDKGEIRWDDGNTTQGR